MVRLQLEHIVESLKLKSGSYGIKWKMQPSLTCRLCLSFIFLSVFVNSLLRLLLQGTVGQHYLSIFHKRWSSVLYSDEDMKGSTESPSLAIREFKQLLSWLPLKVLPVRNLPKQKVIFRHTLSLFTLLFTPYLPVDFTWLFSVYLNLAHPFTHPFPFTLFWVTVFSI